MTGTVLRHRFEEVASRMFQNVDWHPQKEMVIFIYINPVNSEEGTMAFDGLNCGNCDYWHLLGKEWQEEDKNKSEPTPQGECHQGSYWISRHDQSKIWLISPKNGFCGHHTKLDPKLKEIMVQQNSD